MNLENVVFSEISQTQRSHIILFHFREVLKIGKFMQTESRIEVTRVEGRGDGELLFNRYRVSIWKVEKFLKMSNDDGCTTK